MPAGAFSDVEIGQCTAGRDVKLQTHQIKPALHLGDRVLNLNARIHFNKEKFGCEHIKYELHGPGTFVVYASRKSARSINEFAADTVGDHR